MACVITYDQASQVFATQANRLYGSIGENLISDVPFLSVLPTGTIASATAETLTAVVQGRAANGDSLINPTITNLSALCSNAGQTDKTGTNNWTYRPGVKTGISDKICFGAGFNAFTGSLIAQFRSIEDLVKEYINADVRWELFTRSAVKAVVQSGVSPSSMISGSANTIDTPVPAIESDARLTFQLLQKFAQYLVETLKVKQFGAGQGAHVRFIGSYEILDNLRDDVGATAGSSPAYIFPSLVALIGAQSGDKNLTKNVLGYIFEPLLRGIQLGKEQDSLRANWNGTGYDFVEPYVNVAGSTGTIRVTNPGWLEASHEVGFLFAKDSFTREVVAAWSGEGKTKFARQAFGGEVKFINHPDMNCNLFQDHGVLAYRFGRGYKPMYPWAVMPIIYKRCADTAAVTSCSGVSGL